MRRLSLLLALLTLGLATACGEDDKDTGPEGDTDTDTDTDTDADGDTDAGPCNDWTGIAGVGTTWVYDFADGELSGTVDSEVTAYDAGNGSVTVDSDSTIAASGTTTTSLTTTDYLCDAEGFWMLSQYTEYSVEYGETTYEGWTDTTYNAPVLLIPGDLAVGSTWTTSYDGVTETNVSGPQEITSTVEQEAVEEAQATVPAGTYDTIHVIYSGDGSGESWVAAGVGSVKTNVSELVSYTP